MARKKKRGKRKFTLPIAPIVGLAAGIVEPAQQLMAGNMIDAANIASINYLGYDFVNKTFNAQHMLRGLVPLVLGGLVHKFVGGAPLNVNKMLAAAGVPVIRI